MSENPLTDESPAVEAAVERIAERHIVQNFHRSAMRGLAEGMFPRARPDVLAAIVAALEARWDRAARGGRGPIEPPPIRRIDDPDVDRLR